MPQEVELLWVYLSEEPLTWLTVTVIAYALADRLAARVGRHPLANPVVVSAVLVIALLGITGTPFPTYFEGAQFVHFMLGPATVALAIPLVQNRALVRRSAKPIAAALVAGSVTAVTSALVVGWALGLPGDVLASLAPKSVTTPIAMGIAEALGGIPPLTAVLVILTGIIGAVAVTPLMNLLKMTDMRARGFAAGVAAHGIGTARAFQVDPVAGAFAGIGMALNGALTALLTPLAFMLLAAL
ncbi:LrgB family protein [Acuticoccus sp. I52.16.1]|uniref:LrgB family protein n=1 Tax=Acuticoccus sp. I52.16.1 TaxID=2928472 RepID=UPI001FD1FEA3|nr:LrgB family protein [Acuticoccus sp. I52.16.1]UOM33666.1 LrgB family protein [Acuticoccus sp. I52.16.1]